MAQTTDNGTSPASGEIRFCSYCGIRLDNGARFCKGCGRPVVQPAETANCRSSEQKAERKTVYEGAIHKCPNCGEVLASFVANCPSCGYEFRGTKATNSVRELALKLEAIESQRATKRERSAKERLYGEEITKTDEQKISLIRSFSIPNTKEDLYEFLILAESNIDVDLYDGTVLKADARIAVSDAWKAKFEQAYQKAKLLFEDDPRWVAIQQLYDNTHKEIKKSKSKQGREFRVALGILAGLVVILLIVQFFVSPAGEKKELERLDNIVIEVQEALEQKEYRHALRIADSIDYQRYDVEMEREWDIQREYWVEKVLDTASANGVVLKYVSSVDVDNANDKPEEDDDSTGGFIEGIQSGVDAAQENIDEFKSIIDEAKNNFQEASEIPQEAYQTSNNAIEKDSVYTYGHNEWDLYTATALSDSIIKIEKWGKIFSSQKTFEQEYDVGSFKINDTSSGFSWVDESHTAFAFSLIDASNSDFKKAQTIVFTISVSDSDTNKGTNYDEQNISYSYQNDDWHHYKAVLLSEATIKIECWYRAMSIGKFYYGYDVYVINQNDTTTDFEWTDEERTSFAITMKDPENSDLKKSKFVAFTLDK